MLIAIFRISHDNALWWMSQDITDDKSTLVQVMAWCHQAPSHYLSPCWPSSMSPYGFLRQQWVNGQFIVPFLLWQRSYICKWASCWHRRNNMAIIDLSPETHHAKWCIQHLAHGVRNVSKYMYFVAILKSNRINKINCTFTELEFQWEICKCISPALWFELIGVFFHNCSQKECYVTEIEFPHLAKTNECGSFQK